MVANMPISAKPPQYNSSSRGGAADHHHPCPWRWQKPSMDSKAEHGAHHVAISPEESSNSWESRAYAEDANTLAVGIWPPRAYPCGFCRREFRSAQALGGHMNVHRRDRARLRQSSPPPLFHSNLNIPLHTSGNNMHKSSEHEYSSTSISPICVEYPKVFPNESLSKASTLPPASPSSFSAMSYQDSTASLAAKYPLDMAPSFPLRLHLLASEAASTLLLPQAESSDLPVRWPYSAFTSRNGCRSMVGATGTKNNHAIDMSAWSGSPSCSSSTSTVPSRDNTDHDTTIPSLGSKPCRLASGHGAPPIQPEDESPKKKSNFRNSPDIQMYRIINLTNSSADDRMNRAQEIRDSYNSVRINESAASGGRALQSTSDTCRECVDLELRLGQRPP